MEQTQKKKGMDFTWKKKATAFVLSAALLGTTMVTSFAGDETQTKSSILEAEVALTGELGDGKTNDNSDLTVKVHRLTKTFEALVMYKNDEGRSAALEIGSLVENGENFSGLDVVTVRVNEKEFEKLLAEPNILFAEKNVITDASESVNVNMLGAKTVRLENGESAAWGHDAINVEGANDSGFTGKGVKIAILDSGVNKHSELQLAGGYSAVDYTDSYVDDNGHGTHVAGIIGSKRDGKGIAGVAPDAELYSVKVIEGNGKGSLADFTEGVAWAMDNDIDIVNMSIGSTYNSPILHAVVKQATENGVTIVASSGNNGSSNGSAENMLYPALYPETISVGAINENNERAAFSSTGKALDFAAPGDKIVSTSKNGSYEVRSGTSMAAPYVTGMLAIISNSKGLTQAEDFRSTLKESVVDLGTAGHDSEYGHGAANLVELFPYEKTFLTDGLTEAQYNLAITSVEAAEQYKMSIYTNSAVKTVSALIESKEKQELADRLAVIGGYIPGYELTEGVTLHPTVKADVERWVSYAERYKSSSYISSAVNKIDELPTSPEKTAYQVRMQTFGKYLEVASEKEEEGTVVEEVAEKTEAEPVTPVAAVNIDPAKLKKAEQYVGYSEKYSSAFYQTKAVEYVGALPESAERDSLVQRLQKLGLMKEEVVSEKKEEALPLVENKVDPVVSQPISKVETSPSKTAVQVNPIAVKNAEKYVGYAEKYKSSYYERKAVEEVEGLPASVERNALLQRMHALNLMTDVKMYAGLTTTSPDNGSASDSEEPVIQEPAISASTIKQVEQYVGYAEKYSSSYYSRKAQELVDGLPKGTVKATFQKRIDSL